MDGFTEDMTEVVVLAFCICSESPSVPLFPLESITVTVKGVLPAVHVVPESVAVPTTGPPTSVMPVGREPAGV